MTAAARAALPAADWRGRHVRGRVLKSGVPTLAPIAPPFAAVPAAIEDLRAGRMVVVVDDPERENEGDLTVAAEKITPEIVNFMARHGRGLICVALTEERLRELRIRPMSAENTSAFGTAFCESVDARVGITTGISAADRARTVAALVEAATRPEDLARPGHVFPLAARPGGVLARAGQTEAAVDLARLAGLAPAGVICEIMNEDGTMARVPELQQFCAAHALKMISVADLIRHRLQHERFIERVRELDTETRIGRCRLVGYRDTLEGEYHSALVRGRIAGDGPVLVRVQTYCLPATLGATSCVCAANVAAALDRMGEAGHGVLVYLHHDGRVPSLVHTAVAEQEVRRQTGIGAQILADLGVRQIRLLTDHPRRFAGLDGYGLEVVEHVPLLHAGRAR